jgi:hypothetical protein
MFRDLIDKMETFPLEENDLKQVFSVDVGGNPATLKDYLIQSAPTRVLAEFGIRDREGRGPARAREIKSVRTLTDDELEPVVEAYLDSVPEDQVLEVVGKGSFTTDQLREEVRRHSAVGERITEIVRRHNLFLEEAIKRGKIQRKTEEREISLPAFDF